MYIKQVIIQGFKSYRNLTEVEPFDSGINVVVGANGSGKSNFFRAIRLVIHDVFHQQRHDERQQLLHEGVGEPSRSAYVEVVFSNTDRRFPIERDEVRIRRSFDQKRDEFKVDTKTATKFEVQSLLECAGFSGDNPYYVVQQGKIMAMSTMRDSERLELIKEIGGTKVYEDRRKEAQKKIQEFQNKSEKIQDRIQQIEDGFNRINADREELIQYQNLDKQKRSLQYALYQKDNADNQNKLQNVEEQLRETLGQTQNFTGQEAIYDEEYEQLQLTLDQLRQQKQELDKQKEHLLETKDKKSQQIVDQEVKLRHIQQYAQAQNNKREARQVSQTEIESEIQSLQTNLEVSQTELAQIDQQEVEINRELDDQKRKQKAFFQQQGSSSQYKSKKDRDKFLQQEIEQLQKTMSRKREIQGQLERNQQQFDEHIQESNEKKEQKQQQINELKGQLKEVDQNIDGVKKQRDQLANQKRALWQQESSYDSQINNQNKQLQSTEQTIERIIPADIRSGLAKIKELVQTNNIQGVYGPLYENFDSEDKYSTPIEVIAGNALFNVVVDSIDTSTKLVELLNRNKGGRLTFIPLDIIKPSDVQFPQEHRKTVVSLVSRMQFNADLEPAVKQIFGRAALCKDLELASSVSRQFQLDCVTMTGDQVKRKGTLSGGYHDPSRVKLIQIRKQKALSQEIQDLQQKKEEVKSGLFDIEQQHTDILNQFKQLETQKQHLKQELQYQQGEFRDIQKLLNNQASGQRNAQNQVKDISEGLNALQKDIEQHQVAMQQPFQAQLSDEQQQELANIEPKIKDLTDALHNLQAKKFESQANIEQNTNMLEVNQNRWQEIYDQLNEHNVQENSEDEVSNIRQELENLKQSLSDLEKDTSAKQASLSGIVKDIQNTEKQMEELKAKQEQELLQSEQVTRQIDNLRDKIQQFTQQLDSLNKRTRELGSLPNQAFEKEFVAQSKSSLTKQFNHANNELKKYQHINRKAIDQFISLNQELTELLERKESQDRAESTLIELIRNLDMKKNESIDRTVHQVAQNFQDVIQEIAPGARGQLVIQSAKKSQQQQDDPGEIEGAEVQDYVHQAQDFTFDAYRGIQVKIAFGNREAQTTRQLSGGQKTLVALALIFAIQRIDPAPFYLFDEIDAALDPQYRTTVAQMIKKLSQQNNIDNHNGSKDTPLKDLYNQPSQFIVTTFHPQILQQSDRVYGVSQSNRISQIQVISQETAMKFLQSDQEQHQEGDQSKELGTTQPTQSGMRTQQIAA